MGKRECTSCIMCALIMGAFSMRAPPNEEVSLLRAAVDLSSVLLSKKTMKVCSRPRGCRALVVLYRWGEELGGAAGTA